MLLSLLRVKTMSSSSPKKRLRFLVDENIKKELLKFLISKGFDTVPAPKGYTNGQLAKISIVESRILVTNDIHFINSEKFPKEKIFSVVWLRVPQNKPEALLRSFSDLLRKKPKSGDFEGYLIELKEDGFESSEILGSENVHKS